MKSLKNRIKSLTPKQKKLGYVIGGIAILIMISFGLLASLNYQHTKYETQHADLVRAERLPSHPVTIKRR